MKKFTWKKLSLIAGLSLALVAAGCGNDDANNSTDNENDDGNNTTSYSEQLDYTITGIEPGAGITQQALNSLEEYENLEGWELLESSTVGMIGALDNAIKNEEPIIVTGWTPHWMFSGYDIKYLEDPKGVFGGAENINTIVRLGLEEDMPSAYTVLDRFYWEPSDMEEVMYEAQDIPFEEAAHNWIENNQDKVNEWIDGVEEVDGDAIQIVSTPWDSERASAAVIQAVLEQIGYKVTITPVDPAIMVESVAQGEADASLAPWLPSTHKPFIEKHKDNIVDLGANLEGTQNGLVVPAYMDIDSIEDLEPKQ